MFALDCCFRCGSKHLEVKAKDMHFIIEECNKCHKCKDVRYLNASHEFNEKVAKDTAKSVWKAGNNLCTCKSALWLWIGIGTVIAILAGIGGYFWWKNSQKNKEGEEE